MYDNPADILRQHQYRGGSKKVVFCEITYAKLAVLFNVSVRTVRQWVYDNRLDPTNLEDIIDKYNNRYKLDRRRKENASHPLQPIQPLASHAIQGEGHARSSQDT